MLIIESATSSPDGAVSVAGIILLMSNTSQLLILDRLQFQAQKPLHQVEVAVYIFNKNVRTNTSDAAPNSESKYEFCNPVLKRHGS